MTLANRAPADARAQVNGRELVIETTGRKTAACPPTNTRGAALSLRGGMRDDTVHHGAVRAAEIVSSYIIARTRNRRVAARNRRSCRMRLEVPGSERRDGFGPRSCLVERNDGPRTAGALVSVCPQ